MVLSFFTNRDERAKSFTTLKKRICWAFRKKSESSIPIFIFGKQRSGTNMVMDIFRLHSETVVFPESIESDIFKKFQLKGVGEISAVLEKSREPFVCFSPLMDSHRVPELMDCFPKGKFVWVYRDFKDNANSAIRKFPGDEGKIDDIFHDSKQKRWQWFHKGVSEKSKERLTTVYNTNLSEFDKACLVWWVRNNLYLEMDQGYAEHVILLKYEMIAGMNTQQTLEYICHELGMSYQENIIRHVHCKSIGKNPYPELDKKIEALCQEAMIELDTRFNRRFVNFFNNPIGKQFGCHV